MNRWKLTFVIDVPSGLSKLTPVVQVMEDAAEDLGCEVQGQVGYDRVYPPLKIIPGYAGSDPE